MKEITFEQFVEKYKPVKNSEEEFAPYDGYLFEDYQEFVKISNRKYTNGISNKHIWTLVDGDNENSWISTGYHYVNRVGWFITEKPWKDIETTVNLNEMVTSGDAKYACLEFIEEELHIPSEEFEDRLHDWWSNKF